MGRHCSHKPLESALSWLSFNRSLETRIAYTSMLFCYIRERWLIRCIILSIIHPFDKLNDTIFKSLNFQSNLMQSVIAHLTINPMFYRINNAFRIILYWSVANSCLDIIKHIRLSITDNQWIQQNFITDALLCIPRQAVWIKIQLRGRH